MTMMDMTTTASTSRWWYLDDEQLESVMMGLLEGTAWWLGILLAVGAGAFHALGPGHGKTLVGAYLAGSQGRPGDAVALGGLVGVMHTGSVLVVGALFFATQRAPIGDRFEGVLRLLSATAVVAVGIYLLRRALRRRRPQPVPVRGPGAATDRAEGEAHDHAHQHGQESGGGHVHPHGHDHGHHHHHDLPEGVAPLSRTGMLAIATGGGLLPSPAAFLVLATAIAIGRTGYGLLLVAAFGLGLAVTLAAVGLAVLWGRDRLADRASGRLGRVVGHLPLLAAVAVILGGVWLAALALPLL